MNDIEDATPFVLLLLALAIIFATGNIACNQGEETGRARGAAQIRAEAVASGAAHYEVTREGRSEFVWGAKPEAVK